LRPAAFLRSVRRLITARLDMLRDIASGMVFLHSRRPPIVHGDLRSPNLLLDLTIDRDKPRFHVKIADFGLARMLGPTSSITVSKVCPQRVLQAEQCQRCAHSVCCKLSSVKGVPTACCKLSRVTASRLCCS
jgi:serine/threonine protein kinase